MFNLRILLENVLYNFKDIYDSIESNSLDVEDINFLTTLLIDYDSITTAELLQKYQNNKEKCDLIIRSIANRDNNLKSLLKIDSELLKSITEFRNSLCHLEYFLYDNKYINNNVNKKFIIKIRNVIKENIVSVLDTKKGIVEEVKIIIIKDYLYNILFRLGGINYVKKTKY